MTIILLIIIGVLLAVIGLLSFLLFSVFKVMSEFNPSRSLSLDELKEPIRALNKLNGIDPQAYQNLALAVTTTALDQKPADWQQYLKEHHFFAVSTQIDEQ